MRKCTTKNLNPDQGYWLKSLSNVLQVWILQRRQWLGSPSPLAELPAAVPRSGEEDPLDGSLGQGGKAVVQVWGVGLVECTVTMHAAGTGNQGLLAKLFHSSLLRCWLSGMNNAGVRSRPTHLSRTYLTNIATVGKAVWRMNLTQ